MSKSWSGRTQLGRGGSRGKVKGDNNENASLSAASLCLLLQYSVFYSILGLVPLARVLVLVLFDLAIVLMGMLGASCYSDSVFYSLCLLLW